MQQGITKSIEIKSIPWTNLGHDVSQAEDINEVLRISKLNYEINLINVFDENGIQLKGFYGITRSNKPGSVYGFVKNRYVAPQNKAGFEFFDKFIKRSNSTYAYAGTLYDGEIVWFIAKTPNVITIADTSISIYAMFTMHTTGQHSKQVTFIPIRDVCNNILIAPIYGVENVVSISNKKSLIEDNENIDLLMELQDKYVKAIKQTFEALYNHKVTPKDEKVFVNQVVTGKDDNSIQALSGTYLNKIANILDFYKNHPTQSSIVGTAFGLYNAVAGYYMNIKDYSSNEKRFNNHFIYGDATRAAETAFRLVRKFITKR